MTTFTVKIYDHTNTRVRSWIRREERCNEVLTKYAKCQVVFDIEQREFEPIKFNQPFQRGGKTYRKPNRHWFETQFTKPAQGYDFVVASYSEEQFKESEAYDTNGYSGEQVSGVSEILMFGESRYTSVGDGIKVDDWTHTFLHEMCHGVFDHKMGRPDLDTTHDFDTAGNRQLVRAIEQWKLDKDDGSFHQVAFHHTAVQAQDQNQLIAVNRYHRDTRKYPVSSLGWHVAYNYFIDTDGTTTNTRRVGEETYANKGHNCDVPSRCDTISVCCAMDGNVQRMNVKQKQAWRNLMHELGDKTITLHRDIQDNRTCPGKYITVKYLKDVLAEKEDNEDEKRKEIDKELQISIITAMIEVIKTILRIKGVKI